IFTKLDESATSYNLNLVIFGEEGFDNAAAMHERYPARAFYLRCANPYLECESVDNHTVKLRSRYEQLVEMTMNDQRMNNVRVLPQLHTLLWSNKQGV